MKVLIIESEFIIRELVKDILADKVSSFTEVGTFYEADHILKSDQKWDLIILDNHLPDGQGLYLFTYEKARENNIVMATVEAHHSDFVDKAKESGIKYVIPKTDIYNFLIKKADFFYQQTYEKV